ncbi:MAG TPA: peptide ABC transporter substrate-binding protein, partial [Patescibacteria group bacterium]|nr:peptide ABC transporter substrate-binding protein [Patescibacteria group bacterium]
LAADQTLSFPIAQDVSDLDPASMSNPADIDIMRNVFSGLYRFDDRLHEVPDLAQGQPDVSSDGLTYTFHLRQKAQFSNGDPITADDVVYSWNRAAAKQGDYAGLFGLLAGYQDVAAGRSDHLAGLARVDDYTLTATLIKPAGYFITELALWPYWLVDRNAIDIAGEDSWFTHADTLIGSGPFRMATRVAGQSMDFVPLPGWYGGKTGAITHVHVEVVPDLAAQVAQYQAGVFSLLGYARQGLSAADAKRYTSDPVLNAQLSVVPSGTTFWIGFNLKTGPLAGEAGRAGRHALSTSIDRGALAAALCNAGTTCAPASGGLISKGLLGFLGDGADVNAKFDAAAAKSEYQAWDPTGAKVNGLAYTYDTNPFNKAMCENLAAQWKANLGITIPCVELDRKTFIDSRNASCAFALFRQSWNADYDHPQNWFDNLAVTGAGSSGSCYSNANLDQLVTQADATRLSAALTRYVAAGRLLVGDVAVAPLLYGAQAYVIKPYVRGAGGNALYDDLWTGARILSHSNP